MSLANSQKAAPAQNVYNNPQYVTPMNQTQIINQQYQQNQPFAQTPNGAPFNGLPQQNMLQNGLQFPQQQQIMNRGQFVQQQTIMNQTPFGQPPNNQGLFGQPQQQQFVQLPSYEQQQQQLAQFGQQ